jgi:hypothetical protein
MYMRVMMEEAKLCFTAARMQSNLEKGVWKLSLGNGSIYNGIQLRL